GIAADPRYLDISLPPNTRKSLPVETTRHAFAYVFQGAGRFRTPSAPRAVTTDVIREAESAAGLDADGRGAPDLVGDHSLVLFDRGDEVTVHAGPEGIRFLLVSGHPLEEPVAWRGPIVMNTQEELAQAFAELRKGTFIKKATWPLRLP